MGTKLRQNYVQSPNRVLVTVLGTRERLPCFNGVCEYSLPADNGSSSGSMKIDRLTRYL
ncbi:hypothetical protein BDZ89DRAFT_448729 [Hymenopellis radicata]|nr:hypothetical protein BDZ89DRAFT_448729 [Hymenopellis radicata]